MRLTEFQIKNIINLRKKGHSFLEISRACKVPKTTVFDRARDIVILPKYRSEYTQKRKSSVWLCKKNWRKADAFSRSLISNLNDRDLALIGAILYWAEGTKKDFSFSNTDPEMIRVLMHVLRRIYKVKDSDFKITLRIFEDLDKQKCLNYWSKVTGVKLDNKTSINVLVGSKKGKLKYGMCRLRFKNPGQVLKNNLAIVKVVCDLLRPYSSTDRTGDS